MFPLGSTGTVTIPSPGPELQSPEARGCIGCHDGSGTSPAGMDFHPNTIYDQLVNHDIANDGIFGSTCNSQAQLGAKRITPGDLTKSLAVTAHRFSAAAREKIEGAGGSVVALREQAEAKSRKARKIAAAKRAAGTAIPSEANEAEPAADDVPAPEAPEASP